MVTAAGEERDELAPRARVPVGSLGTGADRHEVDAIHGYRSGDDEWRDARFGRREVFGERDLVEV